MVFLPLDAMGTRIPTDWKKLGNLAQDPSAGTAIDSIHHAAIEIAKQICDWKKSNENYQLFQLIDLLGKVAYGTKKTVEG